jgi:Flp pilus assembly protein TadD
MQAAADRAIELDPLLAEAHEAETLAHARMGQWDLAERSFRRAIELDPNRSSAVPFLAQGAPRDAEMRGFLGYVQALLGRRDEAERLAASAEYPNEQALIFAGLRAGDRALQALDRMAMLGPQRVGMF